MQASSPRRSGKEVHRDYVRAGAEIITNTFRLNKRCLRERSMNAAKSCARDIGRPWREVGDGAGRG